MLVEGAAFPAALTWKPAPFPVCPTSLLPHSGLLTPVSLAYLSPSFFLPHSFKIGSGEWASGEDSEISGYVLSVSTPCS